MMLGKPSSAVGWAATLAAVFMLAFHGGGRRHPAFAGADPTAAPSAQQVCEVEWNSGADKFQKTNNKDLQCPDGFSCDVGDVDTGMNDAPYPGVCRSEYCAGKADNELNSGDDRSTIRVTICHRTCSETNPWVRITIDDDAWGNVDYDGDGLIDGNAASGCGHQREHDIRDECSNKAPWLPWGGQYKDYIIKVHGTRDYVKTSNNFNNNQEKAYWRIWERACPYVRSLKDNNPCCDWAAGECCGELPGLPPPDFRDYICEFPDGMADHSVVVEKDCYFTGGTVEGYVSCGGIIRASGSLTINGFLEARFQYSEDDITLNGGSKLLASDVADHNSTEFFQTDVSDLTIDYFNFAWIAEYALNGADNGYTVIVKTSGGEVSNDSLGISSCNEGDKVLVVFDTTDIVTIVPGATGNCFGASIIAPKSLVNIGKTGSVPATVDGLIVAKTLQVVGGDVTFNKNPYAGPPFCVKDSLAPSPEPSPAPTSPPTDAPDPSILLIKKVVKATDSCPIGTTQEMADMVANELVTEEPGTGITYCYYFKNTGNRKICTINLEDPYLDIGGFASAPGVNGCLIPGEESTYEHDTFLPPTSDNEDATITGQPVDAGGSDLGGQVTSSDDAGVEPISIKLEKTYTSDPNNDCSSTNPGVDYLSVDVGTEVKVCYLITNPVPPGGSGDVAPVCALSITDTSGLYTLSSPFAVDEGGNMADGCLPPDGAVYKDGPRFIATASEGNTNATVTGTPSGKTSPTVTASDPAEIFVCLVDMSVTGDTVCPGATGIVVLEQSYPDDAPSVGTDILYALSVDDTSVSFKVMNPFSQPAHMYVLYDGEVDGVAGAFDETCDKRLNVPGCDDNAPTVTVACLAPARDGVTPYAKVWVHFSTSSEDLGSGSANVKDCCVPESDIDSDDVVKYLFVIDCKCPDVASS